MNKRYYLFTHIYIGVTASIMISFGSVFDEINDDKKNRNAEVINHA